MSQAHSMCRQAVTLRLLWEALKDYDMWPIYLLGLTWSIPSTPATNYLTLTLKSLGFGTFTTNLLTIPAYVLFLLQLIFWTWVSERVNERFLIVVMCQFYMLPLVVALEVLPGGATHAWVRYALNALLVGFPYIHAILGRHVVIGRSVQRADHHVVALTSRNAGSVRTRTVGAAAYNMCVQTGNIISQNASDDDLSRSGGLQINVIPRSIAHLTLLYTGRATRFSSA